MPIDGNEWDRLTPHQGVSADMLQILEENYPKAYTAGELYELRNKDTIPEKGNRPQQLTIIINLYILYLEILVRERNVIMKNDPNKNRQYYRAVMD